MCVCAGRTSENRIDEGTAAEKERNTGQRRHDAPCTASSSIHMQCEPLLRSSWHHVALTVAEYAIQGYIFLGMIHPYFLFFLVFLVFVFLGSTSSAPVDE